MEKHQNIIISSFRQCEQTSWRRKDNFQVFLNSNSNKLKIHFISIIRAHKKFPLRVFAAWRLLVLGVVVSIIIEKRWHFLSAFHHEWENEKLKRIEKKIVENRKKYFRKNGNAQRYVQGNVCSFAFIFVFMLNFFLFYFNFFLVKERK